MRWTRAARETNAVCLRTAKSCRSDAPIVGVKSAIRSAGDGVKKRGHRGEREVSRKTIARGMPGRSGVTVVTNSYACFILHARLRVHWAPGIPCALCFRGATFLQNLGRIAPRERSPLSSPGLTGRSSIPERPVMESRSRGVLDTPHARGMTVVNGGGIPDFFVIARSDLSAVAQRAKAEATKQSMAAV
jgi:hypothetical protein